jgi:nitroreductase|tara:strand:+ start:5751 stop:6332 length:582 start_codon:yes stop_codon:yes gene_type:complete
MDALTLLHSRNSAPRLRDPAPEGDVLESILKAGLRAPDHAWLAPWRFLTIASTNREHLGKLFVKAQQAQRKLSGAAELTDGEVKKISAKPLRAPLIVVVIASPTEHPKVPAIEQQLSAGCAAHGIMLAAHASGYGGIWRTGDNAFNQVVMTGLGLQSHESIAGFLYIGTIDGELKPIRNLSVADYSQVWPVTL